jgi:serine/threonine-protein kinase
MRVCPSCSRRYLQDEPFCSLDGARTEAMATVDDGDDAALIGATIGSYRIMRLIGRGGMGRVFEAEHVLIGRRVALKLLNADLCANREIVDRFFNEARAVNQVRHENIVEVTDFGATPDGRSFIVMELLEGVSLRRVLRREKRLGEARAAHVGAQIAGALAGAHGAGIVHRDLKPQNVMLVPRPRDPDFVKLFDFGVAKLLDPDSSGVETRAGVVLGTPRYMSPEQAESRPVDNRSDVYALGILLYEMVTGEVPFDGTVREVLQKHMMAAPRRPSELVPGLSPALERVILQCLEKDRDRRPENAAEVEKALRAVTRASAVAAAREAPDEQPTTLEHSNGQLQVAPARGAMRLRTTVLAAAAVGVLGGLAVIGVVLFGVGDAGDDVGHPPPAARARPLPEWGNGAPVRSIAIPVPAPLAIPVPMETARSAAPESAPVSAEAATAAAEARVPAKGAKAPKAPGPKKKAAVFTLD